MDIKRIKKVELHLHLDGSVKPSTLSEILNIDEHEASNLLIAKNKCLDLNEYLTKFDYPIKVMQTKENLTRIARELVDQLIEDNVIYAEVRFAPNKHTSVLSLDEVVTSVLKGLKNEHLKVNLLLCMMRNDSFEDNKKIVDLANEYKKSGVVGIDLAGAEGLYKTELFESLFTYAKSLDIPFTIHAGEADGPESIKKAISFGAKRIGHGVNAINDEETLSMIKENKVLLEICPTSNIQTNIYPYLEYHPVKKFFELKIDLAINTDNRTVSNVSLNDEYKKLAETFDFKEEDFLKMNISAINHAFISDKEKDNLISKLKETN